MKKEIRGVWAHPTPEMLNRDAVARYADKLAANGINALFMHLKGGDGLLYWPSERWRSCVAPGHDQFDFPQALLEECRQRGIEAHAWLIDYFEGENGVAFREHPEWAARDAKGSTSNLEMLRGKPFGPLWMCPAQRPGYTDQWLVPIIGERDPIRERRSPSKKGRRARGQEPGSISRPRPRCRIASSNAGTCSS